MTRGGRALAVLLATLAVVAAACLSAPPEGAHDSDEPPPLATAGEEVAAPAELRSESLERHAKEVTLRVRNLGCARVVTGSAFAIGERMLVTNRHVVEGAERLEVNTWDGVTLDVEIVQAVMSHDIAVAEVTARLPQTAEVAEDDARAGQPIVVAGYPRGGELTVEEGVVLRRTSDVVFGAEAGALALDARVAPGNSGGPVLDADGRVVGIVYAVGNDRPVGLAVPVSALSEALADTEGLVEVPDCAEAAS